MVDERNMKIQKTFKFSKEMIDMLEELASETGKTYTQLIEEAFAMYYKNETKTKEQLQVYKEENEKLKMLLRLFQEKEKTLEKVEEAYQMVVKEKDERIKDLQEQLRIERERYVNNEKKPFWKFWK